jgi:hypothetical protein
MHGTNEEGEEEEKNGLANIESRILEGGARSGGESLGSNGVQVSLRRCGKNKGEEVTCRECFG